MAINPDNSTATEAQKSASSIATLRKINLNVDLATQAELISVYNDLTAQIEAIAISNFYDKTEINAISTALSDAAAADIGAEATAREEADNAITASLTAYALSTTVADAYKVTIDGTGTPTEGYLKSYKIKQGTEDVGTIDIPKDLVVTGGSVIEKDGVQTLELSIANQAEPVDIPVSDLVDIYEGLTSDTAAVTIVDGTKISVDVLDKGYATTTYVNEVSAEISAAAQADFDPAGAAADALTNANKYTDDVSAAIDVRDAVEALETNKADLSTVNDLSGAYASKTVVDAAATTLEGAIVAKDVSAYVDIDEVIGALEDLKAAVAAFATSMKTA